MNHNLKRERKQTKHFIDEQPKFFKGKYHGKNDQWDRDFNGHLPPSVKERREEREERRKGREEREESREEREESREGREDSGEEEEWDSNISDTEESGDEWDSNQEEDSEEEEWDSNEEEESGEAD